MEFWARRHNLPWWLVIAAIAFATQVIVLWHYSIDDAAISFRYARHLAEGKGLVWNPGQPPVEGFSNLLWVLFLAAGNRLGLDIEVLAKFLGICSGAVTLAPLAVICRRIWGSRPSWWFPVVFVSLCPVWAMWVVSGLELALFGFFLTMTVFGLTTSPPAGKWTVGVAICGLILIRPEGMALAGLFLLYAYFSHRALTIRQRLKEYAVPALAFVVCVVGVMLFRLTYYGYPFPNTVYAKFSTALPARTEVGKWALFCLPYLLAFAPGLRRSIEPHHRFVLGAALVLVIGQMLVVLPVIPVMYFLHRYQISFLPLAVLAVPAPFEWLARRRPRLLPFAAAVLLVWTVHQWPAVIASNTGECRYYRLHRCVVEKLALLPGRPSIALLDAGRIPYWSDLPALDAWGLCDVRIGHEGFSPETVFQGPSGPPDVYIMTVDAFEKNVIPRLGFDRLLSAAPFFQQKYRLWQVCTSEYYYGYAILLNIDWAAKNAVQVPEPK